MKMDFAWAAENRERILAEWDQALRRQDRETLNYFRSLRQTTA